MNYMIRICLKRFIMCTDYPHQSFDSILSTHYNRDDPYFLFVFKDDKYIIYLRDETRRSYMKWSSEDTDNLPLWGAKQDGDIEEIFPMVKLDVDEKMI